MTAADKRAYPEACQIAENIRILLARYRETQETLAKFVRFTDRTLRSRMDRPWEFRFWELESIARFFGVTVRDLTKPMKFEED